MKYVFPKKKKGSGSSLPFLSFLCLLCLLWGSTLSLQAAALVNETDHAYCMYQIFAGTQSEATGTALGNISWGKNVNADELMKKLTAMPAFSACKTAQDAARVLAENPAQAESFAVLVSRYLTGSGVSIAADAAEVTPEPGYYLVVDTTPTDGGENQAKNLSMLKVTGEEPLVIRNKTDIPSVEKKVKDINDSEDTAAGEWQDSADHDLLDVIDFQLTGTLPENYGDYSSYTLIFHDTQSKGLEFKQIKKVYLADKDGKEQAEFGTSDYSCTSTEKGFDVTFSDLKTSTLREKISKDCRIIVEYEAVLSEEAIIGFQGNPNQVFLEYSNNPNVGGEGETGVTPPDRVIVFTYELKVDKVDKEKKPLEGAGFTLYKYSKDKETYVAVGEEVKGPAMTTFLFKGLDDGLYRLCETTTPDGYNTAKDLEFEITGSHDVLSENPKLTKLSCTNEEITVEQDGDMNYTGNLLTTVENLKGALLPSTGGNGTHLIYLAGGLLLALGLAGICRKRKQA